MGAHLRELSNQKIEELGLIYKLKLLICTIFKRLNFIKSPKYEFDNCPAAPTKIKKSLQVIGSEGSFWFGVFGL